MQESRSSSSQLAKNKRPMWHLDADNSRPRGGTGAGCAMRHRQVASLAFVYWQRHGRVSVMSLVSSGCAGNPASVRTPPGPGSAGTSIVRPAGAWPGVIKSRFPPPGVGSCSRMSISIFYYSRPSNPSTLLLSAEQIQTNHRVGALTVLGSIYTKNNVRSRMLSHAPHISHILHIDMIAYFT